MRISGSDGSVRQGAHPLLREKSTLPASRFQVQEFVRKPRHGSLLLVHNLQNYGSCYSDRKTLLFYPENGLFGGDLGVKMMFFSGKLLRNPVWRAKSANESIKNIPAFSKQGMNLLNTCDIDIVQRPSSETPPYRHHGGLRPVFFFGFEKSANKNSACAEKKIPTNNSKSAKNYL